MQHKQPKRLNIGSGQRPFGPGWTNVDINPRWNPDVLADAASMPMFEDATADLIVAHHVIEHVGLGEFDGAVRECHRVLRPGGSLIITTPDLDALVRGWIEQRLTDYLFCVQLYGAYMDNEADRHKWLYTKQTLAKAVGNAAQWEKLLPFDWGRIDGADIARDWYILGLEAVK